MGQFEPPLKIFLFENMKIFNFFLFPMDQKNQNESAPIFYYGKIPKTNKNDLKIPDLQLRTALLNDTSNHLIKCEINTSFLTLQIKYRFS